MITLEMCLDYIKQYCRNPHNEYAPIVLSDAQIKFLGNLCDGKITNTPRGFGQTMLIRLYCRCLDYYHMMARYDENIKIDDNISFKETVDA